MTFNLKQYENSKRIETETIEDFEAPLYLDDFIKFFQDKEKELSKQGRPWLDFSYNEWDEPPMLQLSFGYERPKTKEELEISKKLDKLHAKNKRKSDANMLMKLFEKNRLLKKCLLIYKDKTYIEIE